MIPSAAFVQELTRHQQALCAYLCSLTGNTADAEELLQEVNAQLWEQRERYGPQRPFLPWARTIAPYQVLDFRTRTFEQQPAWERTARNQARDYRDGRLVATAPIRKYLPLVIGDAELGNWGQPVGTPHQIPNLNGAIDELALIARPVADAEVAQLYQAGRPE